MGFPCISLFFFGVRNDDPMLRLFDNIRFINNWCVRVPAVSLGSELATPYCRMCELPGEKLVIGSDYFTSISPAVFLASCVRFLLFIIRYIRPEGAWQWFATARKTAADLLYMTISCPNHFGSSPIYFNPVLRVSRRVNVYNASLSHVRIREKRRVRMLCENKSFQNATECVNSSVRMQRVIDSW